MDANGQTYFMLADGNHWHIDSDPANLEYDSDKRCLRLVSQRRAVTFDDAVIAAQEKLGIIPQTLDRHGNRAFWNDTTGSIVVSGAFDSPVSIFKPDTTLGVPSDIAMGYDGILYLAYESGVLMYDVRKRWSPTLVSLINFNPWRLAAHPCGGMWILDKTNNQLARLQGQPLPQRAYSPYNVDVMRPCNENPTPPTITLVETAQWPEGENPVALACNVAGELVCLSWAPEDTALLRLLDSGLHLSNSVQLLGIKRPFSLGWVGKNRIAVLVTGAVREAPVYRLMKKQSSLWPVGDIYPLKPQYNGGPFLHGVPDSSSDPIHYPVVDGSRELHKLSFPFFADIGYANNNVMYAPLDSGNARTVWHRLYIEAVVPKACKIRIWLAAFNKRIQISDIESSDWYEHRVGNEFVNEAEVVGESAIPVAVWETFPSEVAHHPGLLPCNPEKNKSGLFSVLIQRSNRKVRAMSGRYLYVRVELAGNGHASPEIYAVRAYASRFSYVTNYLPRLYWESTYAPDSDITGSATPADFLERYIGNVEGLLTTMEDRVAASYLVTHPNTVPVESLEWLGSWIGYEFDDVIPLHARREFLKHASTLYFWHGTLRGLKMALEIATHGAVSGGEVVVLEDFRLRRTFATIIGADLADENDALTAGAAQSGNSYVGDTLFIGEEHRKEFLALFSADLAVTALEQAAINALFDKLAYRVTILVHEEVVAQDLGLINRIAAREVPAHVEFRVVTATYPFLVSMASLMGVDTYLAKEIPKQTARIALSKLGRHDFIQGPDSLDPRLERGGLGYEEISRAPIAYAADVAAEFGSDITLDAGASRAFGGHTIVEYKWKYEGGSSDDNS